VGPLLIAGVVVATLAVAPASAAEGQGTHFIAEAGLGYAVGSAFPESPAGMTTRIAIGAGGKLVGHPTRFYAIASLGLSTLRSTIDGPLSRARTDRDWLTWSVGLRTLTPVAGRLRLLAEVGAGQALTWGSVSLFGGREIYRAEDTSFLIEVALGVQYRAGRSFSVGARVDLQIPSSLETFDVLAELGGVPSHRAGTVNPGLTLTATLHL